MHGMATASSTAWPRPPAGHGHGLQHCFDHGLQGPPSRAPKKPQAGPPLSPSWAPETVLEAVIEAVLEAVAMPCMRPRHAQDIGVAVMKLPPPPP
jgi:hypothetical protein